MRIEIPVTRDPNYKPKSLVEHAYEHGKKDGAKELLDYLRKMALTQDYLAYDCYVEARDWAAKTFGIEASADSSAQTDDMHIGEVESAYMYPVSDARLQHIEVENPHPEYQEYVEMVDGILAEEKKRL